MAAASFLLVIAAAQISGWAGGFTNYQLALSCGAPNLSEISPRQRAVLVPRAHVLELAGVEANSPGTAIQAQASEEAEVRAAKDFSLMECLFVSSWLG